MEDLLQRTSVSPSCLLGCGYRAYNDVLSTVVIISACDMRKLLCRSFVWRSESWVRTVGTRSCNLLNTNQTKKSCSTIRYEDAWGERRYSSYSFSFSALDGGQWSAARPGRDLPPGKGPPVPIVQEAGWTPEPVWIQRLEEKSFRLCRGSNLNHPVVQPVARHYTDWATRLTTNLTPSPNIACWFLSKLTQLICKSFRDCINCGGYSFETRSSDQLNSMPLALNSPWRSEEIHTADWHAGRFSNWVTLKCKTYFRFAKLL
jgi:hypothetical protein